jgi:CMP-N-acetylneuraminic acid synthetase
MVVALIPIRSGSKSIPSKNIKKLLGKPLFYWVTNAALNSVLVDKVVISTDSKEYAEIASSLFAGVVDIHIRSEETSTDEASTESVMLEYLNQSYLSKNDDLLLLQATSPMTNSNDIDSAISKYRKNDFSSLLSVVEMKRFIWTESESGEIKPFNYFPKSRPRRQDMSGEFVENGAIYINSVGNITRDECRLSGPNYGVYIMDEDTFFEIDEPSDWAMVEHKMKIKMNRLNIYIDIDNTICNSSGTDYTKSTPIKEAIEKANQLYDNGHNIIYWTARGTLTGIGWRDVTSKQLKEWGAKYHELKMGKPAFDLFIDDKNMNSNNWWDKIDDVLKKNEF